MSTANQGPPGLGAPGHANKQAHITTKKQPDEIQLIGATLDFNPLPTRPPWPQHKISVSFPSGNMTLQKGFEVTSKITSPFTWNVEGYTPILVDNEMRVVVKETIKGSLEHVFDLATIGSTVKYTRSLKLTFGQSKEAQDALAINLTHASGALASKKSILERMGYARKFLGLVSSFSDAIGDLHPAARIAMGVFDLLYKKLEEQEETNSSILELLNSLLKLLPFVDNADDAVMKLRVTREVVEEMFVHIQKVSDFALKLADGNEIQSIMSSVAEKASKFTVQLTALKEKYDRCIAHETLTAVQEVDIKSSLKLLNPVGISYGSGDGCLEGTREDILTKITEWASLGDSNVFWLHGPAGSGKSTVATTVALKLQRGKGGTFFCKRDSEVQRKAASIIPTLVFRLAKALPAFGRLVALVIEEEGNVGSSIDWQFENLLLGPLKLLEKEKGSIQSHLWVIDALDECYPQTDREMLVQKLCSLQETAPWLKIFITSRPYEHIDSAFKRSTEAVIEMDMKDLEGTSSDIGLFLEDCLNKIAKKQRRVPYNLWLSEKEKGALLHKASNLFVWVSTMQKYLMAALDFKTSLHTILNTESSTKEEFGHLYSLYSTVLGETDDAMFSSNHAFMGKIVTAIVITSRHSALPPDALAFLLNEDLSSIQNVLHNLKAVLHVDGVIRVHHPSFLDFIESNSHPERFHYPNKKLNAKMMERCLKGLSEHLEFNICGLETSYLANKDVQELGFKIQHRISPLLIYSCLYWVEHLQESGELLEEPIKHVIYDFITSPKCFLWLEIFSLLELVSQAISIIDKLKLQQVVNQI
ncbi:hypothetical protein SCHPADRAFT_1000213 [Schizopora paradoxa]|uniref:Nephrocystin 3-like N-terminal domain-containing protein n=1 Tax=Schizopora paradoxa TaxID=27342 RepID=A0A0H2RXJ4_9AGAM|nr:hypothetical protein SCHPADRAFT_1000213 [Schizopora paradoxa]